MSALRVGCVEYINALPLTLAFRLGKINFEGSFTYAIPSTLNAFLKKNCVDVALTSSIEYLNESYQLISNFCIAAHHEIMSVNLYFKKPLQSVQIAVTHHSATSIALLKVLCRLFWKISPEFIPLDRNVALERYDAFLLIGDEALKKRVLTGYQTIDLAKAWFDMTALPFVFAVFSARNNVEIEKVHMLEDKLKDSLAWGKDNEETLISYAHTKSGLSPQLIQKYYQVCKYQLGDKEFEGLAKFKELIHHV